MNFQGRIIKDLLVKLNGVEQGKVLKIIEVINKL